MKPTARLRSYLVACGSLLAVTTSNAATLFWDGDLGTSGAQDVAGTFTWAPGDLKFWNGSADVATTNNTTTDIAQFGNGGTLASPATINVSTQSINGLIFGATTTSGYNLTATSAAALTIGGSGIVINSGAQATSVGSANLGITLGAAQSWTNNSASLLTIGGAVTNGSNLLTVGGTGNTTVSGIIGAGSGGLTKSGAGTLTLSAANSYTGVTTISAGVLQVSSLANAGAASNIGQFAAAGATGLSLNGGTLRYTGGSTSIDRGFTLAASSTIDVNATSTALTLGNSSLGAFTLTATGGAGSSLSLGALTLTGAAVLNPTTANLTVASVTATNLGLTLGGTSTGNTVTGAINTGTGTLTKNTASTWTLSGTNLYTGTTTVSGGLLRVNGSLAAGSAVGVSGGALGGTGTVNGAVTVSSVGGMNLTDGAAATLTLGSTLSITGAAGANNLIFDLASAGTTTDKIAAVGAFSMTTSGAGVVSLNQLGGAANRLTVGTYDLITAASGITAGGGQFRLATTKAFGQTFSLAGTTTTAFKLTTTQVTGAVLASTTLSGSNPSWQTPGNFSGGAIPDYQSNVIINSAIGITGTLDASQNINSLTYGTGATVATTITPGTAAAGTPFNMLVIEAGSANGNTTGNGITLNNASGTHTISANVGLAASQAWTVGTGAGLTVSGVISDFGGGYGLTKAGGGTLTLSGVNTFRGPLTIANGTVRADGGALKGANGLLGAGTTLVMGSNGQTGRLAIQVDAGLTIDKDITLATGGTGEFQFGNLGNFTNTNTDRPLTFSGNISGSGNFTKLGGSAISLTGNNTFTGTTTINEGSLRLSSATALSGGIGATGGNSALTINGNGTINVGALVALTAAGGDFLRGLGTGADQFQITGGVSGFEAFGSARQVIVGNDAAFELQWGIPTFNPSTLLFGYNTVTATGALTLQNKIDLNAATRTIEVRSNTATLSGDIRTSSGTAGLIKTGAGTLVLSGANTYDGPTTVNAGTLSISGANTGAGAITVNAGTLLISGANTGSGATTVNATGTLTLSGADGSIASRAVTMAGGTLTLSNTGAANNGDRLSDTLAFTMGGATFNFNNDASANSFSESVGTLTLTGGSNTVAIQQAAVAQTSTLTFAGLSRTMGTLNFSGAGLGAAVDPRSKITFTSTPALTGGIIGQWATVNGASFATLSGNDVVAYGGHTDVTRQNSGTKAIPDSPSADVRIIEGTGGSPANITLAAPTTVINTLLHSISGGTAAATVDIAAGQTLRVSAINAVTTSGALTIGTAAGTGTLTPATAGGNLLLINSSANAMTVNSVIANHTSASSLTKDGSGTVSLAGTNTYTGGLTMNAGTLNLVSAATLGSPSSITFAGDSTLAHTVSGGSLTLSQPVVINSGVTAKFDKGGGGGGGTFIFNGGLSGSGTLNFTSGGSGGGTFTLNNAAALTGTVQLGSDYLTNGSTTISASALGDGGKIRHAGTSIALTFTYTGAGATFNTRQLEMASNQSMTLNNNGSGALVFNQPLSVTAAGNKTLTLSGTGTGFTNTFAGQIADGTGAVIGLTKTAASTWALTNAANTYTGVTTLTAGTLEATTLANGGANSSIGASSNAAANLSFGGGTLRYVGGAASTDRSFTMTAAGTIDASGTGAVNFTNTATPGYGGVNTARALTLTGTNVGDNTLAATLTNNGTGLNTVTKTGTGTWVLSGGNTYGGTTTASVGTLRGAQTSGTPFGTGATTIGAGILSLAPTGSAANVSVTGGNVANANNFTYNAGATFSLDKGANSSLTYTFSRTNAAVGLARGTNGTMILSVGAIANLGNTVAAGGERFLITAAATPVTLVNNLVSAVVAQDRGNANAGDFVTYDGTDGFKAATYTHTNSFTSPGTTTNTSVVNITGATDSGASSAAYALRVDNSTLTNTGTLTLGGSAAGVAGLILNNGTISGGNSLTTPTSVAAELTVYTSGTSVISTPILTATSQAGMSVFGPGTLALSSGTANTFTGGLRINNSTVIASDDNQLGGNTGTITLTGGTLQTSGAFSLGTNGQRAITLAPGEDQSGGTFNVTGGTTIFQNASSGTKILSGTGSLTKSGAGILELTGNTTNTYTGGTFVNVGTLQLGAANMLADLGDLTVGGGTFDIQGFSDTVGAITLTGGTISGTTGVLTGSAYSLRNGAVSAIIGGSGALTKSTSGTVSLTKANTYTGATNVSAGALDVTGSGTINSTSGITVAAGARLAYNNISTALTVAPTLSGNGTSNRAVLGGTGTIGVALTLDNLGDTLSPGNSPGIMPFATGQTWNSFSYDWELNDWSAAVAGTNFDQITIAGALDLSGGINSYMLNILSLTGANAAGDVSNFAESNKSWTILTTTGGISSFDAANWTVNPAGFTNNDLGSWSLSQSGNDLVLSYTAIPEPSAAALLGGLGALLLLRRRR